MAISAMENEPDTVADCDADGEPAGMIRPRFVVYTLLAVDVFWLRELDWNHTLEYLL